MKWVVRVALILGTLLSVALVLREGLGPILSLLRAAGWMLLWLVPLHTLPLLLDVAGWRTLLRALGVAAPLRAPARLLLIASVREAVNRLLPVANIGGEIVGIRMLCQAGGEAASVAASVVVEVLLTIISQLLFAALGVLLLLRLTGKVAAATDLFIGLALCLPLIAALYMLVRRGSIFARLLRAVEGMLDLPAHLRVLRDQAVALDARLQQLLGHSAALLATIGWQLAGFVAGALETWLALRWLQHPVGFGTALALESLTQAIRHFIFVVPAGLGVQEAGLVGFGYLLGLGNDTSIALSLAKRMREVLFGVPALVYWGTRMSAAALEIGSLAHRELLAGFFMDSYVDYVPEQVQWPRLSPESQQRLVTLPFWQEAVATENVTSNTVAAAAALEPDPGLRKAIELQGFEEGRHARLLRALTTHYNIPVDHPPRYEPHDLEHDFLFAGFGECFDSFFAFGLFALARESGFFEPKLIEVFEPVVQEEARHILFFVNWVKYRRSQLPWWRRPAFSVRCGGIILKQVWSRAKTARTLGGSPQAAPATPKRPVTGGADDDNFTLSAHHELGEDVTLHKLLGRCLRENAARLAPYDARLLRPRLVPALAGFMYRVLPKRI